MRGEREEAQRELQQILAIRPGNISAMLDLAVLALSAQQPGHALSRLDVVLAEEPVNPRARYYRALALQLLDRIDEADTLLESLAAESPSKYADWARERLQGVHAEATSHGARAETRSTGARLAAEQR